MFNNTLLQQQSLGDDAIVSLTSEVKVNNLTSNFSVYTGLIHSVGAEAIGFNGFSILDDPAGQASNQVILLLNTNVKNSAFNAVTP